MNTPFFSIGISVYNAEPFISQTIDSVLSQTYDDWELILVDDCSTDHSWTILQEYARKYSNILIFQTSSNTGGARGPFDIAMSKAKGEYCLGIGHDDQLTSTYLEQIKKRIEQTNADVIISRNIVRDAKTQELQQVLPCKEVDVAKIYTGREACLLTLPSWRLGANGMAYKRCLYQYVMRENTSTYMNADELSSRIILIHAQNVSFSNAEYTYWQLDSSVTHKLSIRLFEGLYLFDELIKFAETYFDKSCVQPLCRSYLCNLIVLQKKFFAQRNMLTASAEKRVEFVLEDNFRLLKKHSDMLESLSSKIYGFNYALLKFLCYIKTKISNK